MVSDFAATCPQELTVTKGQQVEVVEVCATKSDYCLVRMPTRGTDHDSSIPEGLVPLAVLKQPPASRSSPSRRPPIDHDLGKLVLTALTSFYLRPLTISIIINHQQPRLVCVCGYFDCNFASVIRKWMWCGSVVLLK